MFIVRGADSDRCLTERRHNEHIFRPGIDDLVDHIARYLKRGVRTEIRILSRNRQASRATQHHDGFFAIVTVNGRPAAGLDGLHPHFQGLHPMFRPGQGLVVQTGEGKFLYCFVVDNWHMLFLLQKVLLHSYHTSEVSSSRYDGEAAPGNLDVTG